MSIQKSRLDSAGGIQVDRSIEDVDVHACMEATLERLDGRRGAVFASGYEYPGRYSRWDIGFVDPPLELVSRQRDFEVRALNGRGEALLGMIGPALRGLDHIETLEEAGGLLRGSVKPMPPHFLEEERSKQPTVFSVLRALQGLLAVPDDSHLGLYGALGYDLVFQFEPIELRHDRPADRPDLHLFLPDELLVVDHRKEQARRYRYDFTAGSYSTRGLPRDTAEATYAPGAATGVESDHRPGEYADKVRRVIEGTRRGDYFEVVPSQVLSAGYAGTPRRLFDAIRRTNPSPYEFFINLGGGEFLVGASPEMFVRVEDGRIETCPIAGTIRRGDTPLEDADRILELLNSAKDEAELTMCTDVDRNDKARVCKAGSVEVLGRRLIETYSRLIHTVDYVVGELRDGFDGFDALLSHMWAVTLTGAPKPAAMQEIENLENSARRWYGGSVGMLLFNGQVNTGITIRTVHLEEGKAKVRVGATLLCDSDPDDEERETRTKAEAFINAVLGKKAPAPKRPTMAPTGQGKTVLFVDNRDSFVHTLGDYMRQTGAAVTTVRAGFPPAVFDEVRPDLVFVSPGPGTPAEFGVPGLVRDCVERGLPVFGVCLGLQGMVEAFGGRLGILDYPMHGKGSTVRCSGTGLLEGFPDAFEAGRYHSLYAVPDALPDCFEVLARTDDGVIMAIEHRDYPAAAVQFHPESILTLKDETGHRLIERVVERLAR